jgi:polyisoprenoid-binding protein YceI
MSRKAWSSSIVVVVGIVLSLVLAACQSEPSQAVQGSAAHSTPVAGQAAVATATTAVAADEAQPTVAAETAGAAAAVAEPAAGSTPLRFQIVPEGTEARFLIEEVLMGQDKTVVGATSQVSGDITVDPADPATAQVGEIRVDAGSLATDDNRRNGRLRNDILKSATAQYQTIVFQPAAISGMPDSVAVGEPFSFQLTGNLTILDTTAPVTFEMIVTPTSTSQLTGSGRATIRHADFGIRIPSVPIVAGVGDEVQLEIDFTARAGA